MYTLNFYRPLLFTFFFLFHNAVSFGFTLDGCGNNSPIREFWAQWNGHVNSYTRLHLSTELMVRFYTVSGGLAMHQLEDQTFAGPKIEIGVPTGHICYFTAVETWVKFYGSLSFLTNFNGTVIISPEIGYNHRLAKQWHLNANLSYFDYSKQLERPEGFAPPLSLGLGVKWIIAPKVNTGSRYWK